jgi:DNA ligase-1
MIHQLFETLASDNGRKFKEDLLSQHKDNELVKRVVQLACDPSINFYQRKIPAYAPRLDGGVKGLDWALAELAALTNRTVTGKDAIDHLTMILENVGANDGEVIKRIIQKDLRCGMSDSTANKVWKGMIAEFPYMRCCLPKHTKMEKFGWKAGVFSQLKADGMFANVNLFNDLGVSILSRSGSEFPMEKFGELADEIKNTFMAGTQTHGELLVARNGVVLPREIGNGILNSVLKGGDFDAGDVPILLAWDQIPLDQVVPGNKYKVAYRKRFESLRLQIEDDNTPRLIQLIPTRIVHSMEEARAHYKEMLGKGYEGTIIKDGDAIWEDTTSKSQVKFKLEVTVDLKIIGFTAGNGKNAASFGAIQTETSDGLLAVDVSGFKDKKKPGILTRQEISDMRDELIGTIMAVKANDLMPPTKSNPKWSLFLPRFEEFRRDKKTADTLAQVQDQFENAIKA